MYTTISSQNCIVSFTNPEENLPKSSKFNVSERYQVQSPHKIMFDIHTYKDKKILEKNHWVQTEWKEVQTTKKSTKLKNNQLSEK